MILMTWKHWEIWFLIAILAVGLFLRCWQLDYSLPNLDFADEEFFTVPALRVADGNPDPGWFNTPAQPLIYIDALIFKGVAFITGQTYQENITLFQTAGRVPFALFGTVMILGAYLVGRRFNRRVAVIAATLFTFNHVLVLHSHIIRPDIMQLTFMIFAIYGALRIIEEPDRPRWHWLTGILWGFAVTVKYPALIFGIPLLLLWLQLRRRTARWFEHLTRTFFAAFAATVVVAPYCYLHPILSLRGIIFETLPAHLGHDNLGFIGNIGWYFSQCLDWEIGTGWFLLAAGILIVLAIKRWRGQRSTGAEQTLFIGLVAVWYIIGISVIDLHWDRWAIPAAGFLLLVAAVALDGIWKQLRSPLLITVVMILLWIAPGVRLLRTLNALASSPTTTLAYEWMDENLLAGTTVLAEAHTPASTAGNYQLLMGHRFTLKNLSNYQEQNIKYASVTEASYGMAKREAARPGADAVLGAVVKEEEDLLRKSKLLWSVHANDDYPGADLIEADDISILLSPTIRYRLGPYIYLYELPEAEGAD